MDPDLQLLLDTAETVWGIVMLLLNLLPLALLIFLVVKLNRMERKLDGALERLRELQATEAPPTR
jgi:hypothetical protein